MCTKCTLACRGGGGVSFRESFAAGAQACGMCRRKTQAARCMVACSRWKRGSRGHTAFIIDTLPSVRSPLVRVPTLRHALRMPMCPCGFLSGCHLCAVWVPPSPRVRCRKACITLTLPYTLYGTQSGAPASYGYALYGSCSRQSRERMDLDLSVSFRQVYVNLTEPSLSSGNNVINSTGPVVVRLAERAKNEEEWISVLKV